MSLKGIDSQLMVTRTAEAGKDTANQMRKDINAQEFLSAQSRVMQEQGKQTVAGPEEAYQGQLRPDKDGAKDRRGGRGQKKNEGKPDDGELPVGFKENKIDIKI